VAFAGVAGRRRRIRWLADAENVNDWISCHDCVVPVARFRSSTRRGGGGVLAPRPCGGVSGGF